MWLLLSPQHLMLNVLEIDHIVPVAAGGRDTEDNLWLACRTCNMAKGTQTHSVDPLTGLDVPLFNPRNQNWWDHFRWSDSGVEIIGVTPTGRATVGALQMNQLVCVMVRSNWVRVGWHPPKK